MQWANFTSMITVLVTIALSATLMLSRKKTEINQSLVIYPVRYNYAQHAYFSYSFALLLTSLFSNSFWFLGYRSKLVELISIFLRWIQRVQYFVLNNVSEKSSSRPTSRGQNCFDLYFVLFLALWYTIVMCEWSLDMQLFAIFYFILVAPTIVTRFFRNNIGSGLNIELLFYLSTILWLRLMVPFNEIQILSRMMRTALIILLMVYKNSDKMHHTLSSEFYICLSTLLTGIEFLYFPRTKQIDQNGMDVSDQRHGLIPHKFRTYTPKFLSSYKLSLSYEAFLDENLVALGFVCLLTLAFRKNDSGKGRKDRNPKPDTTQHFENINDKGVKTFLGRLWGFVYFLKTGRTHKGSQGVISVSTLLPSIPCKPNHVEWNNRKCAAVFRSLSKGDGERAFNTTGLSPSNCTASPISGKAKTEDDFACSSPSLSEEGTLHSIHNEKRPHISMVVHSAVREITAKFIDNTLLETCPEIEQVSMSNSYRRASADEVLNTDDPHTFEGFENGFVFANTTEIDSNVSVGDFLASKSLSIFHKVLPKGKKDQDQDELKSVACDNLDSTTSTSSLKTKESDFINSEKSTTINIQETLGCGCDSKTLVEYQDEKNEELKSTSLDHKRRDSLQQSTEMDKQTSLDDIITSLSQFSHQTTEYIESHLKTDEDLADHSEDIQRPAEAALKDNVDVESVSEPFARVLSRIHSSQSVESTQFLNSYPGTLSGYSQKDSEEIKKKIRRLILS
ncbi:unnamed protein product [Phytomonas sp. Hart1]|nr:unnamed protein product [Phytomonas sp. Hart1]|eukprot:CCW69895.1 unnamed protein product [Phytomonas sp. isolate Hart1]